MHAPYHYDVAIIGSGPAGLFAALELVHSRPELKIILLEAGARRSRLESENPNCGFGGAGSFSDGKLTFEPSIGGNLADFIGREEFKTLSGEVESTWMSFMRKGASSLLFNDLSASGVSTLAKNAFAQGMKLIPYKVRHFGTDNAYDIIDNIYARLSEKGVHIIVDHEVSSIQPVGDSWDITAGNMIFCASKVITAVGRTGSGWLKTELERLGVVVTSNGVDIGVRAEMPWHTLAHITDNLYDMKLVYRSRSFDDKVRSFCVNPRGFISIEDYHGLKTVNGHSYADKKSDNTNFSILVTQKFTEPFKDSYLYARNIAQLSNLLGDPVIVQRLGDLKNGRRSTPSRIRNSKDFIEPTLKATPGDLSLVLPFRVLTDIVEFLETLDKIAPGAGSEHTLLYGVEVKFYSYRPALLDSSRTSFEVLPNLYVAGDGSGFTRGLMQASMMGMLVGRSIASA